MDNAEKDLIKKVVNDRIGSGEIQEISDKDLKKIVSDMLKEELITKTSHEKDS